MSDLQTTVTQQPTDKLTLNDWKHVNAQDEAYRRAMAADDAFQAAVVKQFGRKNAGNMRYQSKKHNTETKAAAEAFWLASNALIEANRAARLEVR